MSEGYGGEGGGRPDRGGDDDRRHGGDGDRGYGGGGGYGGRSEGGGGGGYGGRSEGGGYGGRRDGPGGRREPRGPMTVKARLRAKARKKARRAQKQRAKAGKLFVRKKVSRLTTDSTLVVDYKDPKTLRYFVTETGKIVPRRISGNTAKQQREVCIAIKRARHLALLAYSGQES